MQILHLPHPHQANHAEFVTFAQNKQESYALLTHIAHILLHIFCMYAHILHHCRLVLRTYNFTIETVFYIKCMCIQPQFFQDQLHSLTPVTHQNQNSQRCRYARLQPVYCQLIVLTSAILILAK